MFVFSALRRFGFTKITATSLALGYFESNLSLLSFWKKALLQPSVGFLLGAIPKDFLDALEEMYFDVGNFKKTLRHAGGRLLRDIYFKRSKFYRDLRVEKDKNKI